MRREFPKAIKRAAFERSAGHCEGLLPNGLRCSAKLDRGVEYDHDKPDYMGGEAALENCVCLCRICHKSKTARDRPINDRTRRIVDRNKYGIKKRPSFAGSRSDWRKRKVDGTVVDRRTGQPIGRRT